MMSPDITDFKLFDCLYCMLVHSVTRFLIETRPELLKTDYHMSGDDLLRSSTLYREFQAERDEILKHKWLESEKAGCDIGFETALTDWIIKHRSNWRRSRKASQERTG